MKLNINGIEVNNVATPYYGEITEVNDMQVTVRIAARMGIIKMPLRAVLGEENPKVGDRVTWKMSLLELESMEAYRVEKNVIDQKMMQHSEAV